MAFNLVAEARHESAAASSGLRAQRACRETPRLVQLKQILERRSATTARLGAILDRSPRAKGFQKRTAAIGGTSSSGDRQRYGRGVLQRVIKVGEKEYSKEQARAVLGSTEGADVAVQLWDLSNRVFESEEAMIAEARSRSYAWRMTGKKGKLLESSSSFTATTDEQAAKEFGKKFLYRAMFAHEFAHLVQNGALAAASDNAFFGLTGNPNYAGNLIGTSHDKQVYTHLVEFIVRESVSEFTHGLLKFPIAKIEAAQSKPRSEIDASIGGVRSSPSVGIGPGGGGPTAGLDIAKFNQWFADGTVTWRLLRALPDLAADPAPKPGSNQKKRALKAAIEGQRRDDASASSSPAVAASAATSSSVAAASSSPPSVVASAAPQ